MVFPQQFCPGFLWGVSTAAHQVEGSNHNNQWSDWESAGHIRSGDRCGLACDWWNNAERDFDLAQEMGLNALRLSVEWSRLEPQPDQWDSAAFGRYRTMLSALRQRNIQPMVCLHHFTHPRWFEHEGAFLATDAADRFELFTRRVVEELGDLCQHWVTFNEPNVYAALGYVLGNFRPVEGEKSLLRCAWSTGSRHVMVALFMQSMNFSPAHRWDGLTTMWSSSRRIENLHPTAGLLLSCVNSSTKLSSA